MNTGKSMAGEKGIKKKITNIWGSSSRVSPYVMKAVISQKTINSGLMMDRFEAMQKALEKDIKKKKFQVGGSTILNNWQKICIVTC